MKSTTGINKTVIEQLKQFSTERTYTDLKFANNERRILMRKLIISLPLLVGILIAAAPTTAAAAIGSYDQDSWEGSSEIMADAVEALRESGEFNEEADIGAPAFDEGEAPEEELEESGEEENNNGIDNNNNNTVVQVIFNDNNSTGEIRHNNVTVATFNYNWTSQEQEWAQRIIEEMAIAMVENNNNDDDNFFLISNINNTVVISASLQQQQ